MDSQKDMQNFSSYIMREYGESVLFNNHKPVDLRHAELFKAWQAAKANAVPDEPTEAMVSAGCSAISYGRTNEENVKRIFKAMIEAQEPANADTNS